MGKLCPANTANLRGVGWVTSGSTDFRSSTACGRVDTTTSEWSPCWGDAGTFSVHALHRAVQAPHARNPTARRKGCAGTLLSVSLRRSKRTVAWVYRPQQRHQPTWCHSPGTLQPEQAAPSVRQCESYPESGEERYRIAQNWNRRKLLFKASIQNNNNNS